MRNAYAYVSVASDDTIPQVYERVCLVVMAILTVGTQGDSCECASCHISYEHSGICATHVYS